jgi:hypothetical protein
VQAPRRFDHERFFNDLLLIPYAFAGQIYGDFSGYSDIARGAGGTSASAHGCGITCTSRSVATVTAT